MPTVFEKLNLGRHQEIVVLGSPPGFEAALKALSGVTVHRKLAGSRQIGFALAFVTQQAEVNALAARLLPRTPGDAIIWLAYPKGTSRRFQAEINRDHGWDAMSAGGFETVRQIAIDEDWSALRFRRTEFIGSGRKR